MIYKTLVGEGKGSNSLKSSFLHKRTNVFAGALCLVSVLGAGCGKGTEDNGQCGGFDEKHTIIFEISKDKSKTSVKLNALVKAELKLLNMSGELPPTSDVPANQAKFLITAAGAFSEEVVFDLKMPKEVKVDGLKTAFTFCGYKFEGEGIESCDYLSVSPKVKCTVTIGSTSEFIK